MTKYKYTRKELSKMFMNPQYGWGRLIDDLLAQKEDRKECKCSCHQINSVAFACTECQKNHPTPSPLEGFEEIEEIKRMIVYPDICEDLAKVVKEMVENQNTLISNQKKLYQYIKEKKI